MCNDCSGPDATVNDTRNAQTVTQEACTDFHEAGSASGFPSTQTALDTICVTQLLTL